MRHHVRARSVVGKVKRACYTFEHLQLCRGPALHHCHGYVGGRTCPRRQSACLVHELAMLLGDVEIGLRDGGNCCLAHCELLFECQNLRSSPNQVGFLVLLSHLIDLSI